MAPDGDNGTPEPKPPWWRIIAHQFKPRSVVPVDRRRNTPRDRGAAFRPGPGRPPGYAERLKRLEEPALNALERLLRGNSAQTMAAAREVLARLHPMASMDETGSVLRIIVGDETEVLGAPDTPALPERTEDDTPNGEET
jgi:hypothetical protein